MFTGDGSDLDTTGWTEAWDKRPQMFRTDDDFVDRWQWLAAGRPIDGRRDGRRTRTTGNAAGD